MAVSNKLGDLNNILFATLDRLDDEDLTVEELNQEIKRSKAITGVASAIVANGNLALQAQKHFDNQGSEQDEVPEMLRLEVK